MKNSGGFIKRRIPLGDHKEPVTEDQSLVGQRFAGDGDQPAEPASTSTEPNGPDAVQDGDATTTLSDTKPKPARRSTTPKQVPAIDAGIGGKRYTLILKIEPELVGLAAKTNALSRPDLKRALLNELKKRVLQSGGKAKSYGPKTTTPVRVDLRLPNAMVERIVNAERQSPFEPVSTVLARFVSGYYATMLRELIGSPVK